MMYDISFIFLCFRHIFLKLMFSKTLSEYFCLLCFRRMCLQQLLLKIPYEKYEKFHVSETSAKMILPSCFAYIYMFNSETWPFFSEWVVKLCKYRRDQTVRTTRHLLMLPTTFVSTIECLGLEYFYQMVMEYFHQIFPSIISIKWLSRNIGIFEIFLSNVFGIFLSNVYLELSYLYFLLKPYLSLCLAALLLVFNEKNRCK